MLGKYRGQPGEMDEDPTLSVLASKYKPVVLKVKPVYAELPEHYRIKREIKEDPLAGMPKLNPTPPDYKPTGRYHQERKDDLDKVHKEGFLWPDS